MCSIKNFLPVYLYIQRSIPRDLILSSYKVAFNSKYLFAFREGSTSTHVIHLFRHFSEYELQNHRQRQ